MAASVITHEFVAVTMKSLHEKYIKNIWLLQHNKALQLV